jgi:hypothetical protein
VRNFRLDSLRRVAGQPCGSPAPHLIDINTRRVNEQNVGWFGSWAKHPQSEPDRGVGQHLGGQGDDRFDATGGQQGGANLPFSSPEQRTRRGQDVGATIRREVRDRVLQPGKIS